MPRRCFVIVNPTSGTYSQSKVGRILASLASSGLEPVLLPTQTAMDPTLFASRICADTENPLIVVAGGDGTINGVLNGLIPGAATLAVIPLGTSNVLARELNIGSVKDAVRRIARGQSRSISVGELQGKGLKRRFVLMAGVGVDGEVVKGVRLPEKRRYGKGAYLLSALRLLSAWDRGHLRIKGDGKDLSCHSVVVCNAAKYGGNFVLSHDASIFSPGFQVVCINGGRLSYLKLFLLLALGKVAESGSVTMFPATDVEVSGKKAVQLDGDFCGSAPLRINTIPDFVRVIV